MNCVDSVVDTFFFQAHGRFTFIACTLIFNCIPPGKEFFLHTVPSSTFSVDPFQSTVCKSKELTGELFTFAGTDCQEQHTAMLRSKEVISFV